MGDAKRRLSWATLTDFDDRCDEFLENLPTEERARAERFRIGSARRRFVLARTLLRRELATIVGVEPSVVGIGVGERGKPHMTGPQTATPPRFNLSHSGDLVVVVIADVEVGVDVEHLRPVANADRLARRYFSPAERRMVRALGGAERDRAFLRIWTQKEAYLKATGIGVGMPLRGVETEFDPNAAPRLIAIGGDSDEAARWELREIGIPGAVCTAASLGSIRHLEIHRRTPADFDRA